MNNAKHKLLIVWRLTVLLLLLLNLLVGCQNLKETRSASQTVGLASQSETLTDPMHLQVLVGRVIKVADGDTVTVLDANNTQHRVRLIQIDAPELKQPFSRVARDALADLIATKEVSIKVDGMDRYQRLLGEIFIDNLNVNLYMVRQGYAWAYTQYVTDSRYSDAQQAAQREKLGLWRDPNPLAPWEYRRQQRQ